MDELLNEDKELTHRAILSSIRKSVSMDERHCLLLILEHIIKIRTGNDFKTSFYNTIRGSAEDILKLIGEEVQHLKMESQVNFILSPTDVADENVDDFSASYSKMNSLSLSDSVPDLPNNLGSAVNSDLSFTANSNQAGFGMNNTHIVLPTDILKDNNVNQLASSRAPRVLPPSQIRFNNPVTPPLHPYNTSFSESTQKSPDAAAPTLYPGALSAKVTAPRTITINTDRTVDSAPVLTALPPSSYTSIPSGDPPPVNNKSQNGKIDSRFKHESTSSSVSALSSVEEETVKPVSNPDVSMGNTVYQHRVLTQAQVESFISNQELKTELREIGGFYSISPAEDTNHFNISVSGSKEIAEQSFELIQKYFPESDVKYVTRSVLLKPSLNLMINGTTYKFVKRLFSDVDIRCSTKGEKLEYKLSGIQKSVEDLAVFLEFLVAPPDKKYGFMFSLHPSLTTSPERTEQLRNKVFRLASVPDNEVIICSSPQIQESKWIFVPGIVGQQHLFKIQKHLNVLVDTFEGSSKADERGNELVDSNKQSDDIVGEISRNIIAYSFKELLDIKPLCTEPHNALIDSNLPIYKSKSTP